MLNSGSTTMIGLYQCCCRCTYSVYILVLYQKIHILRIVVFLLFLNKKDGTTGIVELLLLQNFPAVQLYFKLFINSNDGLICFGWSTYRKTRREWFIFSKTLVFRSYNIHTFIYCWRIATCISYELNYCYSTICRSFCRVESLGIWYQHVIICHSYYYTIICLSFGSFIGSVNVHKFGLFDSSMYYYQLYVVL